MDNLELIIGGIAIVSGVSVKIYIHIKGAEKRRRKESGIYINEISDCYENITSEHELRIFIREIQKHIAYLEKDETKQAQVLHEKAQVLQGNIEDYLSNLQGNYKAKNQAKIVYLKEAK